MKVYFLILSALCALLYYACASSHSKPSAWPAASSSKKLLAKTNKREHKDYTRLLFAGDTHFQWSVAKIQEETGLLSPIRDLSPIFEEADFRAINLETVIANRGFPIKNKAYIFSSPSTNLAVLRRLRVDLAILGNNHSMDMGKTGLRHMIQLLSRSSIAHVGAGMNEAASKKVFLFQKHKQKFAVFSFSHIGISAIFSKGGKAGVSAGISFKELRKLSKTRHCIVSIHWGREYFLYPSAAQIKLARKLVKAGAAAVIGHHPHVPQAIEIYKGSLIAYSLGNFLFGSLHDLQRDNILLRLDFSKTKQALDRVVIIPIAGYYQKRGHKPYALKTAEELREFWKDYYILLRERSKATSDKLLINERGWGILEGIAD